MPNPNPNFSPIHEMKNVGFASPGAVAWEALGYGSQVRWEWGKGAEGCLFVYLFNYLAVSIFSD